ncbi:MAG: signal transduction histidine kinase [uncultured bacterium (gcode 4)]|uniref:histidine kinase n=1 Tax=uncultured bacterium (gcode 4) TaxID=1234023 RepID=K1YD55_9BACT|nr:MAG: signal transduction histidine kinase [uncultured bacterium (gcode 4)]
MTSSHSLSKQKRRLSILFSLSIFFIIIVLDVGFLSYKYFDYQRQELVRLTSQTQAITKMVEENPNFEQDILQGKGLPIPGGMRRNSMINPSWWRQWRSIQMENFFLYSKQDGGILFSPRKDDELYDSILQEVQEERRDWETSFELNDVEYILLDTPLTQKISAIFFMESRMTLEDMFVDILTYLMGAILLSLGVYIISSRFVNSTLSPVEKNMDDMEQFIHNAGHELKTPIAVIKSSLELMRLSKNYDEGITESIEELDRMNNLIQALISLSTTDNLGSSESVDIMEICKKLQKSYREKLEEKDISLQIVSKKILHVKANREYTEIFLSNLLSNAIKYNRKKGTITITLNQKSITIHDTGIGIAKENLGRIFDRFYQEDETRTKDSFGIGLSLVERIASIYKWNITVESEKWVGTTVKVEF